LLIFFAFAMQCVSTVAVVRRETGGWKWPIAQFAYMSALAYGGAFLAQHLWRYV
jgi:ferrous iron transport protein B